MGRGAEPALALVVLAILVIRRERLPRQWLWLAGPFFVAYLLPELFPFNGLLHAAGDLVLFTVFGAIIVWSLVDARPIVAAALWLAVIFDAGSIAGFASPGPHILWKTWLPAIIATGVAIAGIWRLRRLTSGTTTAGTWTVKTPISEHQLDFGSYQIMVDATDTGGDSISKSVAGPLNYFIEPTITLKASPTVIGQANPTATLSGTVTGLWPDGSTGPIAGVTATTTADVFYQATTDATGKCPIERHHVRDR